MPQVPQYDGQQVTLRPLPGVRQNAPSTEMFMGPARNAAKLGDALGAGADLLEVRAVANATHAHAAADAEMREALGRVRQRQGITAQGATDEFSAEFDKIAQKHGAELDPFARRAFDNLVGKQRTALLATVRDHEANETRRAARDGLISNQAITVDSSATNFTRPDLIAVNIEQGLKSVDALAVMEGWDGDTKALKRGEYLTLHHARVVEAAVDAAPEYARAYFEQHKDQITDADQRARLEKQLRVAGVREAAQSFADEMMAAGVSETKALAEARKRFSGEQEALAVSETKLRFNEQAEAQKQAEAALENQAWAIHLQGKPVPSSLFAKLPAKAAAALLRDIERETETDWTTYGRLMAMPPEQFAKVNLASYFGELANPERKELVKRQATFKNGGEDEKLDALTLTQQFAAIKRDYKLDDKQLGRFQKVAGAAIFQKSKALGRKLDQDERQDLMENLLLEGKVKGSGWIWDDTKRAFEVAGTADAAKFAPDLPTPQTREDFDALPSGALYIDPDDGKPYRKP